MILPSHVKDMLVLSPARRYYLSPLNSTISVWHTRPAAYRKSAMNTPLLSMHPLTPSWSPVWNLPIQVHCLLSHPLCMLADNM